MTKRISKNSPTSGSRNNEVWLAFLGCEHILLTSVFCPLEPQTHFPQGCSVHSLPSLYLWSGLPLPRCRIVQLAFLTFTRFMWAHLPSLSGSVLPLSSVLSADLMGVHSISLSMSPGVKQLKAKVLSSFGLNTAPLSLFSTWTLGH